MKFNKLFHTQFNSRVNIASQDIFNLEKSKSIFELSSSNLIFKYKPVVTIADPFLFVDDDRLYLFYEEQVSLGGKGVIKMRWTTDLVNWSFPITVLKESFHLSYPNVFKFNDCVYMMPETGSDKSVRLYKPNNDFTQWTLYKTILSNKKYVDSSIIFKDNIYFLFTTLCEDNKYKLMLFCSEKIDGKYELHPKSPIAIGNNNGRCGGSVFEYEGKLYRPTQICENYYAEGLKINEILFLTKNNYSEKYLKTIIPNNDEFYSLGGHHFSFVFFKEEIIIATDGLSLSLNFWEVGRRVHRKLKGLV